MHVFSVSTFQCIIFLSNRRTRSRYLHHGLGDIEQAQPLPQMRVFQRLSTEHDDEDSGALLPPATDLAWLSGLYDDAVIASAALGL